MNGLCTRRARKKEVHFLYFISIRSGRAPNDVGITVGARRKKKLFKKINVRTKYKIYKLYFKYNINFDSTNLYNSYILIANIIFF